MDGRPVAFVFYFGLLGRFQPNGDWEFIPNPDTLLVSGLHLILCAAPMTAWVAATITLMRNTPPDDGKRVRGRGIRSMKILSLVALLLIAILNIVVMYIKSWSLIGPLSILVSPGFAWSIPMAVGLVALMSRNNKLSSMKRD
jgi:hypothetical protein